MSLLAEEVVQEWLNRQGFFTLRGARIGVHEIDLLAVKIGPDGVLCRQIEVQSSHNPRSYLSRVPVEIQRSTGRKATSAKYREDDELATGIREWIEKKFDHPLKKALRERLALGPWSRELVVHQLFDQRERKMLTERGIQVHDLKTILFELRSLGSVVASAGGAALIELLVVTVDEPTLSS